ncbi:50S ribosomal protein Mrp49 [Pochonia chlamydosporia 170]|uniref:50S ribosomal protein Mrp49 n=1 Tax=Pochonia chlamydosporia 170 TaxID=1380566 RepID=A0A179G5Y1_METCM|nr:50S ribosomal protein Mrp49 [Pochonia chlamydosporia 170]OAQ72930.1 50S ribosomal protein Mrp49 [Pochonia chlamydosporia 170]
MRSLGERFNLLRKLINLRCGPGAAILSPEVTRIHMDFATRMSDGHMGARKFWRQYLPRLKYHNPSIPMILNRHDSNALPPVMTIYMRTSATASTAETSQPASSRTNLSKAQPPSADEKIVTIDMKNKHSSDILEYFLAETRAKVLQPTNTEIAEIQSLEAMNKQAVLDRERVRALRAEKKKEEDMLKRARAAGGMAEQEEA